MQRSDFESYLRSINVRQDAEFPERIAHYHPTAKGVVLLKALAGLEPERAFMVTAPYGSGKSLTATFLLQVLENSNRSRPVLRRLINERLKKVSPDVAKWAKSQIRAGAHRKRGLVIALEGHADSIAETFRSSTIEACKRVGLATRSLSHKRVKTIDDVLFFLTALSELASSENVGPIAIVWDEFGRHLEALARTGRAEQLAEIQQLAEFVARQTKVTFTLCLLLHQGFLRYAGHLSEAARAEWTKIEGRFRAIQYVDDSPEVYRLVSELLAETGGAPRITLKQCTKVAKRAKALGMFPDVSTTDLKSLVRQAHPLEPAALYLLPRLAARVAQNERTMFDFLARLDGKEEVGVDRLFDYFSPAMQADTSVGGTYRQWLETQSALSKVGDNRLKEAALKTTCLLSLGVSGERFRAKRDLVAFAMSGFAELNGAPSVIQELVQDNLLLHRKHHDEVAVWHGTDADLRARLEDEKDRRRATFDVLAFLQSEYPPPPWRPVEYNADFGVRRYYRSEYLDPGRPELQRDLDARAGRATSDGCIQFLLAEDDDSLRTAEATALESDDLSTLTVVPTRPIQVAEVALEAESLQAMQSDSEIVGQDPLVAPELKQMTDDARGRLAQLLESLLRPGTGGRWFYRGTELEVRTDADVRRKLSEITRTIYPDTPRLQNEMIVRRKPSPVVINSRKKLVMAVLERSGMPGLGIEGNFPDASIFRTILLNTGLYRKEGERWRYAIPDELEDPGLAEVWRQVEQFLTTPSMDPKRPAELIASLTAPPVGLRPGLFPVLLAAGFKAFPGLRTIAQDGVYVKDLTPSIIELLCKEPERFAVQVFDLKQSRARYLRGLIEIFGGGSDGKSVFGADLIRHCYDSAAMWLDRLPPTALSRSVIPEADGVRRALQSPEEPVALFLKRFPSVLGVSLSRPNELLGVVRVGVQALESALSRNYEEARCAIDAALGANCQGKDLRERSGWWAAQFDSEKLREDLSGTAAMALLKTFSLSYDTDQLLVGAICASLGVELPQRWDDRSSSRFNSAVRSAVREVEEGVLRTGGGSAKYTELVEHHLRTLLSQYAAHRGGSQVHRLLTRMAREEWS